jgi:6-phosphofructokinase 1
MAKKSRPHCIGILTAGGDCQALNAAIRGVAKSAVSAYDLQVIGFLDGFRGLVEDRSIFLESGSLSNLLTVGGTILGTSRDKPHRMPVGNQTMDMTEVAVQHYQSHHLDCLVCLGGGGTQKNALRLKQHGLNLITLPKTIDNDVSGTDISFGFDTAMTIAAEAIDRIHTTAESHNRIMVVEIMGHNAGWLALGAGLAGGADAILIPEIPYALSSVVEAVVERSRRGRRFSIIAIAEGAKTVEEAKALSEAAAAAQADSGTKRGRKAKVSANDEEAPHAPAESAAVRLAEALQAKTGMESRVTALGHIQRGGPPTPTDRLLATLLGTKATELIMSATFGVMVGIRGDQCAPVPLEKVAGKLRTVPLDHPWLRSARLVGTCLGE